MKKIYLVIMILIAAGLTIYSCNNSTTPNTYANLSGTIVDSVTSAPVGSAQVIIMNTNISTISNENGYFVISGIPVSENVTSINLNFTKTGYIEKYIATDIIKNDTTRLGTVYLRK